MIYPPTDSIRISCFKLYIFLKSSINEFDILTIGGARNDKLPVLAAIFITCKKEWRS